MVMKKFDVVWHMRENDSQGADNSESPQYPHGAQHPHASSHNITHREDTHYTHPYQKYGYENRKTVSNYSPRREHKEHEEHAPRGILFGVD